MNKTLLYIHGFASAGSSGTAVQMRTHLYPKGVMVESPDIPVDPIEAMLFLRQKVQDVQPSLIVATSMGALYAEQLRGVPRILVNPSFQMARLLMMRGMGRQQFRNKRMDGSKDFKVDKAMIEAFRQVEKHSFEAITPQEKELVWASLVCRTRMSIARAFSASIMARAISSPFRVNIISTGRCWAIRSFLWWNSFFRSSNQYPNGNDTVIEQKR